MFKLFISLVAMAAVVLRASAGSYDAVKYYYLVQYGRTDTTCSQGPTSITMMAIGKCFSQTLGAQSNTDSYVGYATTGYAMASVTQPSTATSTQGTLTLTSYTDSSCTVPVTGSSISMTLPVASSAAPYGPYGLMSQCSNTLPGSTTVVNNQGGIYSFTNKLEMEAILSVFTSGQGPVYGTFADPYCSVENTNDASGNQLPIYTQWSANGACTYSFLTQKFKTESCNSGNGVAGTGAFSNTWQAFSDNQCTQSVASAQTYSETDANFCTPSSDPAFPYFQNPIVGPYTGGFCATGVQTNKYLVLEQYYQDSSCSNGPSAVNAVLLNTCVADSSGYRKATFVPGITAFASGTQGDSVGTLTINAYSDSNCATLITGVTPYTLPVPTGVMGLPSTTCSQGPSGFTNYYFKGGYYVFDDYSKLQATITNNFGPGTILGTYADSACTQINTNTQIGGGLPIMVTYMSNTAACVLNIATKTSLKTTCAGPTDTAVDTSANAGSTYGALTGTVTQYSDSSCATISTAATTYTTGGFCWNSAGTGTSNIVATIGAYTGGFCQLTNEKSYGVQSGGIANNDEADEGFDIITGVTDSPKCRAAYVAAQLTAYPAGTQITVLGVTATGSTSRRLGTPENDHRELSVAGLRFRTIIRNPASTAAALRTAFQSAGNTIRDALTRRLGASVGRTAGAIRTLATRIRSALTPSNLPGSASGTSNACFAANELVTLEDGATKAMADLTVGDRILTVNAKGEQVYSDVAYLPHGKNEASSTFVTVATESGRDVKMTANHILPAGACAAQTLPMVSANQVAVGDCVETVSGREKVVSVGKVEGKGIYTAIAMEELIVVNGIVATPYGGVNPTVANIYYNLHRLMYAYAGSSLMTKSWVQSATEMLWGDMTSINA